MQVNGRTANLLGATALAVTDLMLAGVRSAVGVSSTGAAALVVMLASPGVTVTELGRRVGLSQSATARMVDSLEGNGLVTRRAGVGRWVQIELTRAGQEAANDLLSAREAPLRGVLAGLDDEEQETLAGLLAKLLDRLYGEVGNAELLCRLCDRACCITNATCPVGQAERERG